MLGSTSLLSHSDIVGGHQQDAERGTLLPLLSLLQALLCLYSVMQLRHFLIPEYISSVLDPVSASTHWSSSILPHSALYLRAPWAQLI